MYTANNTNDVKCIFIGDRQKRLNMYLFSLFFYTQTQD